METDAQRRTLWCGNLPENISDEIIYELFHQAGPLDAVNIPRDREGRKRNFCFVVYTHVESLLYAMEVFRGTTLHGRTLAIQLRDKSILNDPLSQDLAYLLGVNYPDPGPQYKDDVFRNVPNQVFNTALQFASESDPIPQDPYGGQQLELSGLATASLQGHWNSHLRPSNQDRLNKRFYPYRDDRNESSDNDKHRRNRHYNERSNYDRPNHKYSHRNDDYDHDRRNHSKHRRN